MKLNARLRRQRHRYQRFFDRDRDAWNFVVWLNKAIRSLDSGKEG